MEGENISTRLPDVAALSLTDLRAAEPYGATTALGIVTERMAEGQPPDEETIMPFGSYIP